MELAAQVGLSSSARPGISHSRHSAQRVGDIMSTDVVTAAPNDTILSIAQKMSEHRVSCVAVTRSDRVIGVLTERDLVTRVLAARKNPAQTHVAEVMSPSVVTIRHSSSLLDAIQKMETMHVRRLLVTAGKAVCGIVTQTDILRGVCRSFEAAVSQQCVLQEEQSELLERAMRSIKRARSALDGIPRALAEMSMDSVTPAAEQTALCAATADASS